MTLLSHLYPLHAVNYCDGCVRTLGCGWCAETCQCLSTAIGAGTSINGDGMIEIPASCPVSSWVDLPQGQTCGALKGEAAGMNVGLIALLLHL